MASSTPPVLPLSNTTTTTTTTTTGSEPPSATSSVRSFVSNLSDSLRNGLSQRRPWSELLDHTAFSKPETLSEATFRIRKNLSYFRINYYAVVSLILAVSLLTNPFSLILLIALLSAWSFLYLFRPSDRPLVLFGRTFTDTESLALLAATTVLVLFLTSVGSVLISALMVGVAVVCVHGAFRVPEDLFLDEQDNSQATGFLSFLRGAAVSAAIPSAPAPPPVAARG